MEENFTIVINNRDHICARSFTAHRGVIQNNEIVIHIDKSYKSCYIKIWKGEKKGDNTARNKTMAPIFSVYYVK